jgi:hypothetical protein
MADPSSYLNGLITVEQRSQKGWKAYLVEQGSQQGWKAYLTGDPTRWAASSLSPDDAVGKLVGSRPDELVAVIRTVGGQPKRFCPNCGRVLAGDEGPSCTDTVGCEAERQGRLRLAEQA